MKFVTITQAGILTPGVRLADLSAVDNLPHLDQGILVWENKKRNLLRLDRKRPPKVFRDAGGMERIQTAAIGSYYPEQSCAPGEQPQIADILFLTKEASHDTLVVAVAMPEQESGPKVTVRRQPERKDEEWHPFAARQGNLLRTPETDLAPDNDPVHLLYASFGEILRFTWSPKQDWVILVDSRDGVHIQSFAAYQQALAEYYQKIDHALTSGML